MEPNHIEPGNDIWHQWTTTTFLNVRACQYWADIASWERFLNAYPAKSLVELGTWTGGFSLFLLLQSLQRGMEFRTVDTAYVGAAETPVGKLIDLKRHCLTMDILGDDGKAVAGVIMRLPKPLILFCDNGQKSKEFRTLVPYLQPGDLIVVHDWLTEFGEGDVDPVRSLVEVLPFNDELGKTMTRFWRRV